ncbi:MAG: hypothetical protein ACRD13_10185 [Terriglobales bacterium]
MALRETVRSRAAVGGVFVGPNPAAEAVQDLERAQFRKEDIAVAVRRGAGGRELAAKTGAEDEEAFLTRMRHTFGAVALTRTAPPIHGATAELGQYFTRAVEQGLPLVTVLAGNRRPEAEQILRRHGADLGPEPSSTQGAHTPRPKAA